MPPDLPRADRWVALDAMRGLAALLVVLYHLRWDWHGHSLVPVRHGFYAVDFFFVLSGFVMAATYGGMRTAADLVRFAVKRAGRLLPLHIAALAAFVALEGAVALADRAGLPAGRQTFDGFTGMTPLLAQATLTFGLIPGLDWLWNHPCWSIAVEFWTYILFGLTVLALRRGRLVLWAALSGLGLIAVAGTPEGLAATSGPAIFRCLLSFFLGTLVHAAYAALRGRGARIRTGTQLAACAATAAVLPLPVASAWSLVIPYVFAGLILCLAFDEGRVARSLGARPLVRLGELSFSIYLVHVPVWFAVENVLRLGAGVGASWLLPDMGATIPVMVSPLGSALAADAVVLAYVGLVLAMSAWTHRRIEVPARNWSRRFADRIAPIAMPAMPRIVRALSGLTPPVIISRSRTSQ
ncbi:acyltransferase [Methylobacterium sp. NEAU 140]|uniref:acyltransferase family protein n=1 Tax=Methylobacterium sp. NEAU 140 TaxID=3064945 RepID=UPI002732392B|nr:acyltransferase [Methylobacterium sp. NEAU 140]MDP4027104.1 acyltransferase [Methylobacterium sp. NEAU 140]